MSLIYITGISGSGKSTVASELKKRGYEAYDADDDGFNHYYDRETNVIVYHKGKNTHTKEWSEKYTWKTDRRQVEKLKKMAEDKNVFLAGIGSNEKEVWDLFDITFCLVISKDVLRHRIETRTENDFGKAPHEMKQLLKWHERYEPDYRSIGSIIIDADQPVKKVADDILRKVT